MARLVLPLIIISNWFSTLIQIMRFIRTLFAPPTLLSLSTSPLHSALSTTPQPTPCTLSTSGQATDRSLNSDLFPGKKLTQIQIWSECVIDGGRLGKFVLEIKLMFCNSEIVTKTYYFPTVISQLFILESPAWLQIVTFHWLATLQFHQESLIVIDDEIIACIQLRPL